MWIFDSTRSKPISSLTFNEFVESVGGKKKKKFVNKPSHVRWAGKWADEVRERGRAISTNERDEIYSFAEKQNKKTFGQQIYQRDDDKKSSRNI